MTRLHGYVSALMCERLRVMPRLPDELSHEIIVWTAVLVVFHLEPLFVFMEDRERRGWQRRTALWNTGGLRVVVTGELVGVLCEIRRWPVFLQVYIFVSAMLLAGVLLGHSSPSQPARPKDSGAG